MRLRVFAHSVPTAHAVASALASPARDAPPLAKLNKRVSRPPATTASRCPSLAGRPSPPHAHLMYLVRNFRWKSLRTVSLIKRFFSAGMLRVWFLKTTSSSHLQRPARSWGRGREGKGV